MLQRAQTDTDGHADTSPQATLLYCSDSILDVLGYSPADVLRRSSWDFFHPEELPMAQHTHTRSVDLDKAAMLTYCRLRHEDGSWIGCEVVFTVVYDVMVGCTSIYRRGMKSHSRAMDAPAVRRIFSNSPRDPRYHMLSHLSSKFTIPPKVQGANEPRAALFLNRYTRTLTVMYATEGLADILGVSGEDFIGKSFYHCIQQRCIGEAVDCLERAKTNNSIAYLRFWFRNPKLGDGNGSPVDDETCVDSEALRSSDEELDTVQRRQQSDASIESRPRHTRTEGSHQEQLTEPPRNSRESSGNSNHPYSHEAVFGEAPQYRSSSLSSISASTNGGHFDRSPSHDQDPLLEMEAVISCTSDGLVVCLREARPVPPLPGAPSNKRPYDTGLFASPWSSEPLVPPPSKRPRFNPSGRSPPGPPPEDFMSAIRDCAVFAWALTGINGALAEYSSGSPKGEAQPEAGLPVWQSEALHNNLDRSAPNASVKIQGENEMLQRPLGDLGNAYNDPQRPTEQAQSFRQ